MLGSKHSVTGHTRQAGEGQAKLQEETYNFTKKLFVTIHFCLQKIVALRQVVLILFKQFLSLKTLNIINKCQSTPRKSSQKKGEFPGAEMSSKRTETMYNFVN